MIEKAKAYAIQAHEGQVRKIAGTPMVEHPIRVADMLKKAGFDDHVVAAGYLHDTVEDTPVTIEDLESLFGASTALLVAANTEDKRLSWEERKQHTLDSIRTAPLSVRALIVADKFDNFMSLKKGHEEMGEQVWSRFKRGRDLQAWYFKGVATNAVYGLEASLIPPFFRQYQQEVEAFFN